MKSALYDRPKDASGDFGFIAERFFRDTEGAFQAASSEVVPAIRENPETDSHVTEALRRWVPVMEKAALRLFDEYAPCEGLEDRDMHRHVKARFFLALALAGHGSIGVSLFDSDLEIPSPHTVRTRSREREAA